MDFSNQYASTIMLLEAARNVYANCSGVLLNPRVALTAASCVCPPRRANEQGIAPKGPVGPSACAEEAFMGRVWYSFRESQRSKERPASLKMRRFAGKVRVHPAFKLELDEKGAVVSTEADLALIILEAPVAESLPFVPFADTEVQEGEMLVMAGYGDDLRFRDEPYLRYFRRNKVTQVQGRSDGKVRYEQQGAFVYNGYTGGPCFREDKRQRWLVGIASVGSEQELAFTSTYFFKDWLRVELQRVGATDSASTPASQLPQ
ncbi:MAG: trypsin-like peptidase domain-containing protein [Myxococcaceae bacterium]|nr:trypsin-like peptidase domain-containing protein [Myxococcaceae bacterium]